MNPIDRLRAAIDGPVITPDDPDFDTHRAPWNLAVPQPALAVVEPTSADEVATLVRIARDGGLTLAPQASGHGASGDTADTVLVRTHRMNDVEVLPDERRAAVGPGARWGQVQAAASPHGLTGLAGSSPVVTVTGYTLGGGLSWFSRKHGWAADAVVAFEVVDAEGAQRRVTADSDADLFWALRGGGGDFAFVTRVEFALVPAPELYGGRMIWPGAAAPQVLDAFREVAANAPDELTVWFERLHFPGSEPMVAVDVTYLGPEGGAKRLLAPFDGVAGRFADTRRMLAVDELGSITAEPTDPSPGAPRGELLTGLDDTIAQTLLADPIAPLLTVQVRQLGGALAGPSDSPHGPLTEPYALYLFGIAATPESGKAVRDRQAEVVESLGTTVSGRKPFTFLTAGESATSAFPPAHLERLRAIKQERDPHGVFRSNFPV